MLYYVIAAAGIAINLVNKDEKFLNKYKLEMIVNDTKCEASDVLKIFTQYVADDNIWPQMIGGLGKLVFPYFFQYVFVDSC